nr:ribonuclease H-like domain, reverse transcriptase, RNA-dependent DNA polymerase [Tanacetum cinerariifolium]
MYTGFATPDVPNVIWGVLHTHNYSPELNEQIATGRYVVPTGRVIVATGRIVSPGSDNDSDDASIHNEATNTQQQPNIQPQIITTVSNNNAKFSYLKKDEYEVWDIKMKYWITNNDMNIWKRNILLFRGNQKQELPCFSPFLMIMWLISIIWMMQGIYEMQLKLEGLHKGYDKMQKILSQLNQLKAKPDAEDINLKFLRALPSSWFQVSLTLKTKGPSHYAFVSATSASKKLSYRDSPNYSSTITYSVPSNSKTRSHRSGNAIEEGAAKIYNLITRADTEEASTADDAGEFALMGITSETKLDNHLVQTEKWRNSSKNLFKLINSSMSVRTKVGLGFTNCISKNKLGWDDSAFSVFTTNSEDVEGRPIFHRFAKTDSMKVVPPSLTGDYTSLSDHIDLDESQMSYGIKSSTSSDSKSVSNDFVSCDDSDKFSEVNTNDFASSDSSVKSSEHQPNDFTFCASTSSVSTSVNEAEIESNVGTPIKEPIIVQDLPSFTCNSSDKNEHTSMTFCNKNGYFNKKAGHFRKHASSVSKLCFVCGSGTHLIKDYDFYEKQMANKTVVVLLRTGKVHIPHVRPQPVPTGKPKVTPIPTGKPKVTPVPAEKVFTGYPRTMVDHIHLHTDDNEADLLTKAFDGPRYVVSTGRVIVPTGRYVVPTGRVIVATVRIVSPGKSQIVIPG